MPLSEEEQRLLEQMEQALVAEDPKFASTLRGSRLRARSRRRAALAALMFVVGLGVLMLGAVLTVTLVAVTGFVVMLLASYAFVTVWRRGHGVTDVPATPRGAGGGPPATGSAVSSSFMDRIEERWRRRRGDGE
ncbi:MAG: DUF3040 domain-containing protein [Nocardioidaceae bacterium]